MRPRLAPIDRRPQRARARTALAALAILFALTPASAQTYSLSQLLQMPFEQLLSLQISGVRR